MDDRTTEDRRVVVGIDGSPESKAALRWAVRHAALDGAVVHAVAAWEYPALYGWFAPMVDDGFEQAAARTLTAEVDEVIGRDRPVPVRESLVLGHAADVLLEAARDADLLVLGSRGRGTFARTLLGSVSARCAIHGSCPVVIVRTGRTATDGAPGARTGAAAGPAPGEPAAGGVGGGAAADGDARPPAPPGAGTAPTDKDWLLRLHLVEDADVTRVRAVLDTGGATLHSESLARRNPHDPPAPAVGDEFAAGRALIDLGHQLLRAGTRGATSPVEE